MKATSIKSDSTRIIPASKANKAVEVTKNQDGSMAIKFGSGQTGTLGASDIDLQAFAVWTMLNSECTA